MSNNTPKLLDVIALTIDLPEYNLQRGQVGTVVELLANGTAFEVEFKSKSWCCILSQQHPISNLKW